MITHAQLTPTFDPALLHCDLERLPLNAFIEHYNKRDYEGAWSVLPLRSINGLPNHIYPDPTGTGKFADTEFLDESPYFKEVIEVFRPSVLSARLLKLGPGAEIKEHTDLRLGLDDDEIRIHIPVMTNPSVEFYVNKERISLAPGESWYINFNLPHSVINRGDTDRVHLVLDCKVTDQLLSLFRERPMINRIPTFIV